jgi:hypothetical protein
MLLYLRLLGLISINLNMDTTIFLAQIWGPVILAIGLGMIFSRNYYLRVYNELDKETLAVMMFGMFGIAAGIAQISIHNVWGNLPQMIVSLLGWLLLIKGLAFAIVPRLVDMGGDRAVESSFTIVGSGLMILVGAYLTWFAYFV